MRDHVISVRPSAAAFACVCGYGCSDWDRRRAAGDGPFLAVTVAAAAGVQTPALGPGTPLPERANARLVVVVISIAGGESILCPVTWVSSSIGPARPLGYPRVTPAGGEPAGPSNPDPPPEEGLPSGEETVGTDMGLASSAAMDPSGHNTRSYRCGVGNKVGSNGGDLVWLYRSPGL